MAAAPGGLTVETAEVVTADGVMLSTEIIRPDDSHQYPALLTRTPYGKPHSRIADDVVGMARVGWVVVIQDVRGRGGSDGTFEPFVDEVRDAAVTLDWIVEQPWSDRRVAMFGGSYRAATAWLAARSGHPALRAVAPYVATSTFGEGWTFEGGIPVRGFLRSWALRFASTDPRRTVDERRAAVGLATADLTPAAAAADDAAVAAQFPAYRAWLDCDHPYWGIVDPNDEKGHMPPDVAGFHVAGWYDMFCEGSLAAFAAACRASRAPQHLVVGPWSHAIAPGTVVGDLDFGPLADRAACGLDAGRDRFLRAALDSPDDLEHRRIDVFQLGAARWLRLPEWPPPSTPWTLPLRGEGTLGDHGERRGLAGSVTIAHDPSDPARSIGGRQPSHRPRPGPVALSTGRPDVARFVSTPLVRDRDVIGVVRVAVRARTVGAADLVIRLIDVHPDGSAYTIVEHGHRLDRLPTTTELELDVGSTAWLAAAGHRVGLELAPAAWPRLGIRPEPFEVTVEIDGASRLELPVVPVQRDSGELFGDTGTR